MKKLLIGSLLFLTACGPNHYTDVIVYCPNSPDLKIDSAYGVYRFETSVHVYYEQNGEDYASVNSPSCTVRTVKVHPITP